MPAAWINSHVAGLKLDTGSLPHPGHFCSDSVTQFPAGSPRVLPKSKYMEPTSEHTPITRPHCWQATSRTWPSPPQRHEQRPARCHSGSTNSIRSSSAMNWRVLGSASSDFTSIGDHSGREKGHVEQSADSDSSPNAVGAPNGPHQLRDGASSSPSPAGTFASQPSRNGAPISHVSCM